MWKYFHYFSIISHSKRGSVSERFVGPSDKSGKNTNSLGLVKVRIVMDQMSGNVEAMKTGREREKIIG